MIDYNDITILNLNEIDKFDLEKKGKFILISGSKFDFDYLINFNKIINNFDYIIFFNQPEILLDKVVQDNVFDKGLINNVFNLKEDKVIKINSWGFTYIESSKRDIKYNYYNPKSENQKLSFILKNKFIFPLFPKQIINIISNTNCIPIHWYDNYLNESQNSQLLELIKPQIISLLENSNNTNIPNWAINYSKKAQKTEIEIIQNVDKVKKLLRENSELKNNKSKLVLKNNFLWSDDSLLEKSIEKIVKNFKNWEKLDQEDQEDLLFKENNNIYIFEIKGTVKCINEGYITQLIKYIATIEEKFPESKYTLYPILFINSQKNIDPKIRDFQYQPEIAKRLIKYKISVVTSTRLYNLLQQKNYEELIINDMKTLGIHDEKIIIEDDKNLIISENVQELIETS